MGFKGHNSSRLEVQTIHEFIEVDPILIRIKANLRPRTKELNPAPLHTGAPGYLHVIQHQNGKLVSFM